MTEHDEWQVHPSRCLILDTDNDAFVHKYRFKRHISWPVSRV